MPAELKGIGVELLEEMLERAGSDQDSADFRVVALENGFEAIKQQQNGLLFSIARTQERPHFR